MAAVTAELVADMERRIEELARVGARDADRRVFLIIDEFAQIQLWPVVTKEESTVHKRLLANLIKLVILGRAPGVRVIAALQKPTADLMDSTFRAMLQGQVCFRVGSKLLAASMFGSTEELALDPTRLRTGQYIFEEPAAGEIRYLQAHVAPGL